MALDSVLFRFVAWASRLSKRHGGAGCLLRRQFGPVCLVCGLSSARHAFNTAAASAVRRNSLNRIITLGTGLGFGTAFESGNGIGDQVVSRKGHP